MILNDPVSFEVAPQELTVYPMIDGGIASGRNANDEGNAVMLEHDEGARVWHIL